MPRRPVKSSSHAFDKAMQGTKTEVSRKKVPKISTINKKIKRLESEVELKYNDVNIALSPDDAGTLTLLNGVPVAPMASTLGRVGNQVNSTSIQIRGFVQANTALTAATAVRLIILWDRQPNGAAPTILGAAPNQQSVLYNSVGGVPEQSPFTYEMNERYRILMDKRFCLNPEVGFTTVPGASPPLPIGATVLLDVVGKRINFKKKIKLNRLIKYQGDDNTIASIATNSLYLLCISDVPNNTTEPTVQAISRYYYKDA